MMPTKMTQTWVKILVLAVLLLSATLTRAEVAIPLLKSHVTDLTATLSASEATQLEQKLAAFEKAKGSQVAVLIVPTTQPETIEQYALRVAETWKLGRKGIDDGVLLLIAKNDRALRIEVGYGVEGALPDAMAKRIIAEIIVPQFKAGSFLAGIDAGIDAILSLLKGESLPSLPSTQNGPGNSSGMHFLLDNFIPVLIGLIVLGRMLQALLGRLVGAAITSIGMGFIGWLFFSSVVAAILITAVVFFISLFQSTGSGIYRNGRSSWSDNGFRNGGFGSGSSGGGFSGGGGGFGGGGASGRW
ncbi:YgcG family protein [Nitrosomonas sp.]|uniref:TPM domain-containing protein n=1 Tax=Nitrosomonas sp. TaxID=42353 RepID=UPI0025EA6D66|nr:YgcG family protein [Nitrosomonas sp.]